MKMIAVSISEKCIKNPRCSFCYAKNEPKYDKWELLQKMRELSLEYSDATFCFEYNGWNLGTLSFMCKNDHVSIRNSEKTVTTMPLSVSEGLIKIFKDIGIKAISLSYDSQKVKDDKKWLNAGRIIKKDSIKLACNYLIEKIPFSIPKEIVNLSDQINLLAKKPTGQLSKKEIKYIKSYIRYLKLYKPVATDNCLGYQLGLVNKCLAGKEFLHVNPDGSVTDCCFKEKCFLYKVKT